MFRQNQHLTGTDTTKNHLLRDYKVRLFIVSHCLPTIGLMHSPAWFLDTFKRANQGNARSRAILARYRYNYAHAKLHYCSNIRLGTRSPIFSLYRQQNV